jgi:lactate dehydrogenase-like 2-hydroxyacid dehydrogenase
MNILITDVVKDKADIEKKIFGKKFSVKVCGAKKNADISLATLKKAYGILAFDTLNFNKDFINKLKNCKVIVRVGVGYDNVDLEYAKKKGIAVCNVPDYGIDEVADYVIGSILFANKNFYEYINITKNKKWTRETRACFRLQGRTLGIIGLGRIGSSIALKAKAFKINIIFYDPYIDSGKDKIFGIKRVQTLKEIAKLSDFISINCPLTSETLDMIDKKFFKNVKRNLILVNAARGKIINLDDLRNAIKLNKIKCAILDVLPKEPISNYHILLKEYFSRKKYLENKLFITPHSAFFSNKSIIEIRQKASIEIKRVLEKQIPYNCVNKFYD